MTKQFRSLAAITVLLTAIAASGQLSHQSRVNVPFAFMAAGGSLPAGDYRVDMDMTRALVTLSAYNSKPIMFLTVRATQMENAQSYLRFHRYGERWFLQEVTIEGMSQIVRIAQREKQFITSSTPPDNAEPIIADIAMP